MIQATSGLSRIPLASNWAVTAVQERGVGRGIRLAEIIDRVDDAPAEQVEPDTVGQVPAELGVVARQPVRQLLEGVLIVAGGPIDASGRSGTSVASTTPVRGWTISARPDR